MRPVSMILALLAVVLAPAAAGAQQVHRPLTAGTAELSAAARLRPPVSSLQGRETFPSRNAMVRPSRRQGETLMIVGGAVLLAGLLVDEAIVSITGLAIGGYGLYVYLNARDRR